MKNSFNPNEINIMEKRRERTENESGNNNPQGKGKKEHLEFEDLIKSGSREGLKGKVLKELESQFDCEFLAAEVDNWGWSVQRSNARFYSGVMDAVAIRVTGPKPEVLVVDWKTTGKTDVSYLRTWWDKGTNFSVPLYQCLVYRELLAKHLSNDLDVKVGVMIVPYHQWHPELLVPGLCLDFTEMEEKGLLTGLKKYRWCSQDSEVVWSIKFPGCKLFKKLKILTELQCVDKSTELLKDGALLKDVISDDATIGVLREELGLLPLKVTNEVEKEGGKEIRVEGRDGGKGGRGRERRANEVGNGVSRSGGEGGRLGLELGLGLVGLGLVGLGLGLLGLGLELGLGLIGVGLGLELGLGLVWLGLRVGVGSWFELGFLGLGLIGVGLGLELGLGLIGVGLGLELGLGLVWLGLRVEVGSGFELGFLGLGLGLGLGLVLVLGLVGLGLWSGFELGFLGLRLGLGLELVLGLVGLGLGLGLGLESGLG